MDVEPLGLAIGETVGNGLESFTHSIQVSETLLQSEVAQIVGDQFIAQEPGELFILLKEGVFPIGSEDVMPMLDLLDDRRQFAADSLIEPDTEDFADAMGRQTPEPEFTTSLEDFVDGKVALEDEVAAVLDLRDGVKPRQVHLAAFLFGELRPQQERPVIELLADDLRAQPVGGR